MRPLRLEIEGLTSFKEKVAIDFDGLDLFAITGPTGAGKSSLIDAMVLALYGQVPRVGDKYKQLISHGAERLSVLLDFRVGAEDYRLARTIRTSGSPQFRLERITGGVNEPLADRAAEVDRRVRAIVGLDYDAFVRSVVLPQGQFDAFLKGKPEERRGILVALLNLGVYQEMHRVVNARAQESRRQAEFIANQLREQFAGVTPEARERLAEELRRARAERQRLSGELEAVRQGLREAQALRALARERAGVARDISAEQKRETAASAALAAHVASRSTLQAELAALEAAPAAAFDEDRHRTLIESKPRVEQLVELQAARARLAKEAEAAGARLAAKQAELDRAAAELPALAAAAEAARAELAVAREEREALHREHAAHELRRHLKPGEPCPVCEQKIKKVPSRGGPDLKAADRTVARAEASSRKADGTAQQARIRLESLGGDRRALAAAADEVQRQAGELVRAEAGLVKVLSASGFAAKELGDPSALRAAIEAERKQLEAAKAARDRAATAKRDLEGRLAGLEAEAASAAAQLATAHARLEELRGRLEQLDADLAKARDRLRERAGEALREQAAATRSGAGAAPDVVAAAGSPASRPGLAQPAAGRSGLPGAPRAHTGQVGLVESGERRGGQATLPVVEDAALHASGWEAVLEPPPGHDEAGVLESLQSSLQASLVDATAREARARSQAERLESDLAQVASLGQRRTEQEAAAALASCLAQHLQANQFLAFVQEEALRVLAEDGSRHLRQLSQGRYSLGSESQEFHVVDHWNGDRERSVKTLSGGESFLASLALALALAERLAELSAAGRAGEALESLFLDEGFGSLDADTLDLVVQALEALHGGQRMVGVVTHLGELAERLPARLEVRRKDDRTAVVVA